MHIGLFENRWTWCKPPKAPFPQENMMIDAFFLVYVQRNPLTVQDFGVCNQFQSNFRWCQTSPSRRLWDGLGDLAIPSRGQPVSVDGSSSWVNYELVQYHVSQVTNSSVCCFPDFFCNCIITNPSTIPISECFISSHSEGRLIWGLGGWAVQRHLWADVYQLFQPLGQGPVKSPKMSHLEDEDWWVDLTRSVSEDSNMEHHVPRDSYRDSDVWLHVWALKIIDSHVWMFFWGWFKFDIG